MPLGSENLVLQNKVKSLICILLQIQSIFVFRGLWVLQCPPRKASPRGGRELHTIQTCLFPGDKNGARKGACPAVDRVPFGDQEPLGSNPGTITYDLVTSLTPSDPQFSLLWNGGVDIIIPVHEQLLRQSQMVVLGTEQVFGTWVLKLLFHLKLRKEMVGNLELRLLFLLGLAGFHQSPLLE